MTVNAIRRPALEKSQRRAAIWFLLPSWAGFTTIILLPTAVSLFLAFTQWDGFNPMQFVGFSNFRRMVSQDVFWTSMGNNLVYTAVVVPGMLVLGMGTALLLNGRLPFRSGFRAIYFLPYITSMVAVSVVWSALYNPNSGPINALLRTIGIMDPPRWLSSSTWALPAIMVVSIWKSFGYNMIIFLAALQGIPRSLYESAEIDGANSTQQLLRITIPLLAPAIFFSAVMTTITSFKVFDQIFMMTQGGPGRATNVLVYLIYQEGFQRARFGFASALSVVLFLMILSITTVQFVMEKKWVTYY